MISGIVLAAGAGRRFGAAKPLASLDGKPLVRHVLDVLAAGGITEIVLVLPPPGDLYTAALLGVSGRVRSVVNELSSDGLSSSLRLGLEAVAGSTEAVLIALADQPHIDPAVIRRIVETWRRDGRPIVAPAYRGERGHPVLFGKALFPELRAVSGDRGAREVIERDASRVALVHIDADVPRDVDTPEDLAALERLARS